MLSTTVVHTCRQCGSERLRKNGHANNGAQRAKCLACGRTFHLEPKGPRYSEEFKRQVVAAYQDRLSIRGIKRTFGVCYQTVLAWVGEKNPGPARVRGHAFAQPKRGRTRTGWTLELCGQEDARVLAVAGPLPAHPPDRRLHDG